MSKDWFDPNWKDNLAAAAVHTHIDQDDGGSGYHPHMRPFLCEGRCGRYVNGLYDKGQTDGRRTCFECAPEAERLKCHKAKVMLERGYTEAECLAYLNNRTSSLIHECEPPPPPERAAERERV